MNELEKLRKKKLLQFMLLFPVDVIILAGIFFVDNSLFVVTIILLILMLVSISYQIKIAKNFEKSVKVTCINNIIANILGSRGEIVWQEGKNTQNIKIKIPFLQENVCGKEVTESRLFSFTDCYDDDIFIGEYAGLKVDIAEFILITGYGKYKSTVFRGPVITLQSEKEFQGHTIIGKKRYVNTKGLQKLKLPMKEFAKKYDVYTNNFDEAGKILAPDLINFLMGMKNIRLACYGNKVVAAIHTNRDMFKLGSLFRPVEDQKQFMKFTEDFNWAIKTIDKLKGLI